MPLAAGPVPGRGRAAERGELLFGTMDTWLIWKLTGRHVTDVTNASRTMLMNLATLDWDDELLEAIGVPARHAAGDPASSAEVYGAAHRACWRACRWPPRWATSRRRCSARPASRPARASAPTAPAASCWSTPASGRWRPTNGLLTTVGYQIGAASRAVYALEGSIAVTGALVQWLRDNLGLIATRRRDRDRWPARVEDNGGCYFVPAFSGLFAPALALATPAA